MVSKLSTFVQCDSLINCWKRDVKCGSESVAKRNVFQQEWLMQKRSGDMEA